MIDVYVATASTPLGSLWMSGCGILLVYNDQDQQRHRFLSFDLDVSSPDTARVQATYLALLAINHVFRRVPIRIHLPDQELLLQLANPVAEHDDLIRRYKCFVDIGFLVETPDDPHIRACLRLAETACQTKKDTDSLTIDGLPNYDED